MCVWACSVPPGFYSLRVGPGSFCRENLVLLAEEGRMDARQPKQMSIAVIKKMFYSKYSFQKSSEMYNLVWKDLQPKCFNA